MYQIWTIYFFHFLNYKFVHEKQNQNDTWTNSFFGYIYIYWNFFLYFSALNLTLKYCTLMIHPVYALCNRIKNNILKRKFILPGFHPARILHIFKSTHILYPPSHSFLYHTATCQGDHPIIKNKYIFKTEVATGAWKVKEETSYIYIKEDN